MHVANSVCLADRLIIREYSKADVDRLYNILSDPVTMQFWPKPYTRDQVVDRIDYNIASYAERGYGRYAILETQSGNLIGECGINQLELDGQVVHDLNYIIDHQYWGRSYATEAATAIKNYACSVLHLDTLYINMPYNHYASIRIAEKLGGIKIKEFFNVKNRNISTFLFVIQF